MTTLIEVVTNPGFFALAAAVALPVASIVLELIYMYRGQSGDPRYGDY